jgi:hypothetical protein
MTIFGYLNKFLNSHTKINFKEARFSDGEKVVKKIP